MAKMRTISDKEFTEITDELESVLANAVAKFHNKLAVKYGFDKADASEVADMGDETGDMPEMRECAISIMRNLGMDVQGDGKGF